ncbi:ATP-dependent helicase HrpB [Deinococcus metallilatus]|uniref:ATP-dependent helicase HrpB n=1 Tax=Deinococcus metallilatus TaxID=1211322 RepID=A0AAJ5F583_9DEIO|nr:ATP-dependent helicase HrpB [Deinococcus metallilatus]QBY09054.1 ATP-dependent helicase HrpB [Deinococcus metallilatus]RXJ10198.1 ATP-dependent helicase HrpB [Deinococcus metallilatus]TLK27865.1 ATP-dependent helicase HrpB [Deinococcus metallilatus]GMA16385.1 ATP-dependent helicase HrpB [Deinococcus metallilatus]
MPPVTLPDLPISEVLPEVRAALERHPLVVLQAPPGAGKSTSLPLALLDEPWLAGQSIVLLQPRRVAARAVAARLAEGLGEEVGGTVGLRVRFESRVSPRTRIEVVTEGILTRRLQRDPELTGVGLVILDEFHERSLNADLALALLREVQGALRDDLRVLVMSATLDPALPGRLDAPLVRSAGRAYPVEVHYLPTDPAGRVEDAVARAVREALATHPEGDILAFLPGVREIRGALAALSGVDALVLPLYGDLPLAEQRRAILPDPGGRRKVVLSTSIAETSLTLSGVRVVVDGGLSRTQRFDPGTGLTRMVTTRVTRDAAEQRAGRAGRTAPGTAYRLWSERTHAALPAARPPEVLDADLTPLTLELAGWGTPDPAALAWLDEPPAPRVQSARALLHDLDALDAGDHITPRGSALLELPTHPRLAHLLHDGTALGLGPLAADVAALLEERDPLGAGAGTDLTDRVAALRAWRRGERGTGEVAVLERVERLSRQWCKLLNVHRDDTPPDPFAVGQLVALAYPERAALAREGGGGRFLLAGGQGARLPEGDVLAASPALAVAHLDAGTGEGRIYLAAPLDPAILEARAEWRGTVRWDARSGTLVAQRERRVGALVLEARPLRDLLHAARVEALAGAIRAEGLHLLTFSPEAENLRARVQSLRRWRPDETEWPDLSDAALLAMLEDWLGPSLEGVRTREDLKRLNLLPALQALLPWPLPPRLDDLAPTHLTVPSGSRVRLQYQPDGSAPILAVKLQELFGLADTPTVNGGRTPVLLHLLSPAGRPVQVTQDLRSFWNSSYFEVRKDLRGRYPKHPWPDDPWTHAPTRHVKKRL